MAWTRSDGRSWQRRCGAIVKGRDWLSLGIPETFPWVFNPSGTKLQRSMEHASQATESLLQERIKPSKPMVLRPYSPLEAKYSPKSGSWHQSEKGVESSEAAYSPVAIRFVELCSLSFSMGAQHKAVWCEEGSRRNSSESSHSVGYM